MSQSLDTSYWQWEPPARFSGEQEGQASASSAEGTGLVGSSLTSSGEAVSVGAEERVVRLQRSSSEQVSAREARGGPDLEAGEGSGLPRAKVRRMFWGRTLVLAVGVVVLAVVGSVSGVQTGGVAARVGDVRPMTGQVVFVNTNPSAAATPPHLLDEVVISLQNVPGPAPGSSYYAWLLPDATNSDGSFIALGRVKLDKGNAHFSYRSFDQSNVLQVVSRFLITEEPTSPQPLAPTADREQWRYFGEFPQTPNLGDADHFSALDHLRHLLVSGPVSMMENRGAVSGGLGFGLLQNTQWAFDWAEGAGEADFPAKRVELRRDLVSLLDTLDGGDLVHLDVSPGTPVYYWPAKPLLTLDPNALIPGFLHDIGVHLLGYSNAPGVTRSKRTVVGQIEANLNHLESVLEQARQDAKRLVALPDRELLAASSLPVLDDLTSALINAFVGQLDPVTGVRRGGAVAIFDQLQHFARFSVGVYTGPR